MRPKGRASWVPVAASAALLGGTVALAESREPTSMVTGTATYR